LLSNDSLSLYLPKPGGLRLSLLAIKGAS